MVERERVKNDATKDSSSFSSSDRVFLLVIFSVDSGLLLRGAEIRQIKLMSFAMGGKGIQHAARVTDRTSSDHSRCLWPVYSTPRKKKIVTAPTNDQQTASINGRCLKPVSVYRINFSSGPEGKKEMLADTYISARWHATSVCMYVRT